MTPLCCELLAFSWSCYATLDLPLLASYLVVELALDIFLHPLLLLKSLSACCSCFLSKVKHYALSDLMWLSFSISFFPCTQQRRAQTISRDSLLQDLLHRGSPSATSRQHLKKRPHGETNISFSMRPPLSAFLLALLSSLLHAQQRQAQTIGRDSLCQDLWRRGVPVSPQGNV